MFKVLTPFHLFFSSSSSSFLSLFIFFLSVEGDKLKHDEDQYASI